MDRFVQAGNSMITEKGTSVGIGTAAPATTQAPPMGLPECGDSIQPHQEATALLLI
jgi:hypothetical protein